MVIISLDISEVSMESIYLDNAATTKPNQNAIKAAMPYLTDYWQNPSAIYSEAGKARQAN